MLCHNDACKKQIDDDSSFCIYCSASQHTIEMAVSRPLLCQNERCGKSIDDDSVYCIYCGAAQKRAKPVITNKTPAPSTPPKMGEATAPLPKVPHRPEKSARPPVQTPVTAPAAPPPAASDKARGLAHLTDKQIEDELAARRKAAAASHGRIREQAPRLMKRYKDAYTVARVADGFGSFIKGLGILIGILAVIIGVLVAGKNGPQAPTAILGIGAGIIGVIVGASFFIWGILISA